MTITPDQADRLAQWSTSGKWEHYDDYGMISLRSGDTAIATDLNVQDADLIAAAPDLAQTIAGMTWEYAVEHEHTPGKWHRVTEWGPEANPYQPGHVLSDDERIVRCLVGPVEVIDGE